MKSVEFQKLFDNTSSIFKENIQYDRQYVGMGVLNTRVPFNTFCNYLFQYMQLINWKL